MSELTAQQKFNNARAKVEELENEIAKAQANHDRLLREHIDQTRRDAEGTKPYHPQTAESNKVERETAQAKIAELTRTRDAIQVALPGLECETFADLAREARAKQSEAATEANALAAEFNGQLLTIADVWARLCKAHTAIRYQSDRLFKFSEKAGGDVALPNAVKLDHKLEDTHAKATEILRIQ